MESAPGLSFAGSLCYVPIINGSKHTMRLSFLLMTLILSQLSCYQKVSYQLLGDVTEIVVMVANKI
jgi:hypothetical protein